MQIWQPQFEIRHILPSRRLIVGSMVMLVLLMAAIFSLQLLPPVMAQDSADQQEPDTAERGSDVTTDQASAPDRSLSIPAVPAADTQNAGSTRANQIVVPTGTQQTSSQISRPDMGRDNFDTQRLEGADACDAVDGQESPTICQNTLETRSAEFSGRVRPRLSAEQRILAQQNPDNRVVDMSDASARRLATNRASDLNSDDFAIASIAINSQNAERPEQDEAADVPADATSAINAILGAINGTTPD